LPQLLIAAGGVSVYRFYYRERNPLKSMDWIYSCRAGKGLLQDFLREKPTICIRPAVGSKWKITGAGEPSSRSSYYRYFFFAAFFFLAFFLAAIIVSLRVVDCFNVQKNFALPTHHTTTTSTVLHFQNSIAMRGVSILCHVLKKKQLFCENDALTLIWPLHGFSK
jgi:hypothetical protein